MRSKPIAMRLFQRLTLLGIGPDQVTEKQLEKMIYESAVLYVKRHRDFPGAPMVTHDMAIMQIKPGQKLPKVTK